MLKNMQILFCKHYVLVFNDVTRQIYIYFYPFSMEYLYFIISRCCIIHIFTKIRQFDGLIYIDQLLQNNKNEVTMNKKKTTPSK